jgi:hypothetical protein
MLNEWAIHKKVKFPIFSVISWWIWIWKQTLTPYGIHAIAPHYIPDDDVMDGLRKFSVPFKERDPQSNPSNILQRLETVYIILLLHKANTKEYFFYCLVPTFNSYNLPSKTKFQLN